LSNASFVAQEAGRRPVHVGVAAGLRGRHRLRRRLAARRAPDRIEPAAGDRLEARADPVELATQRLAVPLQRAARVGAELRAHRQRAVGRDAAEVHVIEGVAAKGMAFLGALAPVAGPAVIEREVAVRRLLVGEEERGAHLVLLQDAGDALGLAHVAGIERQVDGPRRTGSGRGRRDHGRGERQDAEPAREPACHSRGARLCR
jgi:hypothetical protein